MKVTYSQAKNAINTITPPKRLPDGRTQITKSDLAKAKGDLGLKVYHLKHDIKDAFKAHYDKEQSVKEQFAELNKEREEIEDKDKPTKKDKDRLQEIDKEVEALNEDFLDLTESEEEVKLTKGKLKIKKAKEYLDATEIEALEWAIDFSEKKGKG